MGSIAVTIGHFVSIPERIEITGAVMDITIQCKAGIVNTIPVVFCEKIIIGHLCAPMRIGCVFILVGIYIVPAIIRVCKINCSGIVGATQHIIRVDTITATGFPEAVSSAGKIGHDIFCTAICGYRGSGCIGLMDQFTLAKYLSSQGINKYDLPTHRLLCIDVKFPGQSQCRRKDIPLTAIINQFAIGKITR